MSLTFTCNILDEPKAKVKECMLSYLSELMKETIDFLGSNACVKWSKVLFTGDRLSI